MAVVAMQEDETIVRAPKFFRTCNPTDLDFSDAHIALESLVAARLFGAYPQHDCPLGIICECRAQGGTV